MSASGSDALAPRSCRAPDVAALIGLLALLEGELMAGGVPEHLSRRIRDRLERVGLLGAAGTERDLRQSISDLNHRLRYALGEYDEPPRPVAVPE
ncbi:hypothetical protein GCM10012284_65110 [Mangrovihabitans endophyticus]|uniref:Uncharacterized protein n=1 Tax=Mangrovihabitans endophyticus TaxID=1751298 RepID=A0A8J3C5P0_9ACTN|nr:hypothetical protein GCM10012284_65110 [Mangrovihabitans endophyticus]